MAVSPQGPDDSLGLAERMGLGFDVLSDLDQSVAEAYRVRFRLSDEIIRQYTEWGMLLPRPERRRLVGPPGARHLRHRPHGRGARRHVDPDYRQRMDPDSVIAALDALAD